MTLTGCGHSGQAAKNNRIRLAAIPADIRTCMAKEVPAPLPGSMSRAEAATLMAAFRKSDISKSQCGQRLIGWYDAQAKALRK